MATPLEQYNDLCLQALHELQQGLKYTRDKVLSLEWRDAELVAWALRDACIGYAGTVLNGYCSIVIPGFLQSARADCLRNETNKLIDTLQSHWHDSSHAINDDEIAVRVWGVAELSIRNWLATECSELATAAQRHAIVGQLIPGDCGRAEQVESFINAVLAVTGREISGADIYRVAGYKNKTSFQDWKRCDKKTTVAANLAFTRVLGQTPSAFVQELVKKLAGKINTDQK